MSLADPNLPSPANSETTSGSRTKAMLWDFALQMIVTSVVTLVILTLFFGALFILAPALPDNDDYFDVVVAAFILLTALLVVLSTIATYTVLWFIRKRVQLSIVHACAAALSIVIAVVVACVYSTLSAELAITAGTAIVFTLLAVGATYLVRSRIRACKPSSELLTGM